MLNSQSDTYKLSRAKWIFLLLAGTIVRFIFGYLNKPWLGAPDQLAWGLGIDEMLSSGKLNYTQLMHNAFESGSWILGLLSIPFRSLSSIIPSLSWSALLIDLLSRAIQLKIVQKVFGNKSALWFGWWTIFTIPLILPWSTVNCGLHSLSAFFPFLFLFLIIKVQGRKYTSIYLGAFCGLAMCFSFDNLIFFPVSFVFLFWKNINLKNKLASAIYFTSAFLLCFLPFLLARKYLNTGFQLEAESVLSIRGVDFGSLITLKHFAKYVAVWFTTLPLSMLLTDLPIGFSILIGIFILIFISIGIKSFLQSNLFSPLLIITSIGIVLTFFLFYAFSPFYSNYLPSRSYVSYRHLAFIIPFLIAIVIHGFSIMETKGKLFYTTFLSICISGTVFFTLNQPKSEPLYKASGWILAKKYGHDVDQLIRITESEDEKFKNDVFFGYGWGLSATLFERTGNDASIVRLTNLVEKFPDEKKSIVKDGVRFSFDKSVTPVLDKNILLDLEKRNFFR